MKTYMMCMSDFRLWHCEINFCSLNYLLIVSRVCSCVLMCLGDNDWLCFNVHYLPLLLWMLSRSKFLSMIHLQANQPYGGSHNNKFGGQQGYNSYQTHPGHQKPGNKSQKPNISDSFQSKKEAIYIKKKFFPFVLEVLSTLYHAAWVRANVIFMAVFICWRSHIRAEVTAVSTACFDRRWARYTTDATSTEAFF